jgi:cell shape-determining protein MreC
VTKVIRRELGRDQDVDAAPTVDFSRLDAVLVLVTSPAEEPATTSAVGGSSTVGPRGRL